jgi:uncharacterized membrane protein
MVTCARWLVMVLSINISTISRIIIFLLVVMVLLYVGNSILVSLVGQEWITSVESAREIAKSK